MSPNVQFCKCLTIYTRYHGVEVVIKYTERNSFIFARLIRFVFLLVISLGLWNSYYIPRRKSGIYWIQVRRAAAAAVEISLWTR